jgi:lipopolysaccharide transport system ATP-binding protein
MSDTIIRVEGLGKLYRIGARQERYYTLRDAFTQALARPFHKLSSLFGSKGVDRATPESAFIWALKDVSFEVRRGEVIGIIGRNGAGKSTLLRILSRITEPTAGFAELHGRVGSLLEVGTGFHPELTGRENVYLNGVFLGMKRAEIERRFDEIVAFAEVEQFIDTPVKHYSSGMHVRLAFAVAAHLEPEILLVDEVLAVGDTDFQKKCLRKMDDVATQGRTVLFVSHNMSAIEQLCPRALLFRHGSLVHQAATTEVLKHYLSDASASVNGDFDLAEHPARFPNCVPVIRQLTLRSSNINPDHLFYPDDTLIAELTVAPPTPLRHPRIALAIEDCFGRRIMTLASHFQSERLPDIDSPCRVTCILPRLNLGAGRYLVSLSVGSKYEFIDGLHNAAWFEVGWRNNYGNGESYHPFYGPIIMQSAWTIQDASVARHRELNESSAHDA